MNQNKVFLQKVFALLAIIALLGGLGFPAASAVAASPQAPTAYQSVIVQAKDSQLAATMVEQYGGRVTSKLEIIASVGALVPVNEVAALRSDAHVVRVSANAETVLAESGFDRTPANVPNTDYPDVTGANLAWQAGALGQGVTVAVIDTGIARHPALMKDENGNPRRIVVGWVDFVEGKNEPTDPNGHGTHIAGIIANAQKGPDGEYNGMAPAVQLVGIRVLDKTGAGNYEQVIEGIQWAIQNKDRYNIRVINLSLHSLVQSPYWADPLNQAVMHAWADGIVVVVAAGNDGPKPMTISVPGNNPYVITVGAFTDNYTPSNWNDDYLTEFSSAGPTLDGFVKPDLLAPGGHITSTMLPGSYIARSHEANWVDSLYFAMAGTSQAAAVTTGAVAQVIGAHPDLTPDQVKYRMMYTALPWVKPDGSDVLYSVWQQGAGRLNVFDAVNAQDINGSANTGLNIQTDMTT
ncbi:MAG TPA: S8 family peptidase, partial [Anaerolineaceae bacterium]